MKNNEQIRFEANELDELLKQISTKPHEKQYDDVSEVINFITKNTQHVYSENLDQSVFLAGVTHAGKSTLMNYIAGKQLTVQQYAVVDGLGVKGNDSVAEIGTTGESTTTVPNVWKSNIPGFEQVAFIDNAGELDSGGIIMQVINSKARSHFTNNVQSAKFIIVTDQSSLNGGGLGDNFKKVVSNISQLCGGGLEDFKDSIAIIVTRAEITDNTPLQIKNALSKITMSAALVENKPALKHIIEDNQRVAIFSKPAINEIGADYVEAGYNLNQRAKIIDLIKSIEFHPIPKGLLSNASSSEVREHMSKAFEIVKHKAINLLHSAVEKAVTPKMIVYATDLKDFVSTTESLLNQDQQSIGQYYSFLTKNKFIANEKFVNTISAKQIHKLDSELRFLVEFTAENKDNQQAKLLADWSTDIEVYKIIKAALDEAKIVISKADSLFTAFSTGKHLDTIGHFGNNGQESQLVKEYFIKLKQHQSKKENIQDLYNKKSAPYYGYKTHTYSYNSTKKVEEDIPLNERETMIVYEQEKHEVFRADREWENDVTLTNAITGIFALPLIPIVKLFGDEVRLPDGRYVDKTTGRMVTEYRDVAKEVPDPNAPKTRMVDKIVSNTGSYQSWAEVPGRYQQELKSVDNELKLITENMKGHFNKFKGDNLTNKRLIELAQDILDQSKNQLLKELDTNFSKSMPKEAQDLYEQWQDYEYEAKLINDMVFAQRDLVGNLEPIQDL